MAHNPDNTSSLRRDLEETQARLLEAEQTLSAIRSGEVDGLVVNGAAGPQVFTLKSSEEPYRMLIERMTEGALTLSPEGIILYANQAFARLLQVPLEQVIGADLRSFLSPANDADLAGIIAAAWEGSSRVELPVRAADGSSIPMRLGLSWLQLDPQRLLCVVATDLTEEKKREESMRQLHTNLEKRVAERTTDLAAARVAALNMMEDAVESRKALEAVNQELEHEIVERKLAEAEARLINTGLEARVNERTAQLRNANQVLTRRTVELEAALKELDSFAYSVSHDLRAPLRHISGFAGLLRTSAGPGLADKSRQYLDQITGAATQMGQLIDDLLLFSRMGRTELRLQPLDLADLVEESIHQLQPETKGRNILWTKHPLPAVRADPVLLRQALINLLGNAIKYTRPRDPAKIEIGCSGGDGREQVIYVRDNGVGFDMRYADKLFDVFQRLHADEDFEGTGIGLANVRRVITRHGGRTWAEGKVGEGATFYFSLPAHAPGADSGNSNTAADGPTDPDL